MGARGTAAAAEVDDIHSTLALDWRRVACVLKVVLHVADFRYALLTLSEINYNGFQILFDSKNSVV